MHDGHWPCEALVTNIFGAPIVLIVVGIIVNTEVMVFSNNVRQYVKEFTATLPIEK